MEHKAEGKADWVVPTGRLFHLPTDQSSQPTHAGISNTVVVFLSLPSLCQQQIQAAGVLLPSLHWEVATRLREAFLGGLCVWWEDGILQSRWMSLPSGQCRSCQEHRQWDVGSAFTPKAEGNGMGAAIAQGNSTSPVGNRCPAGFSPQRGLTQIHAHKSRIAWGLSFLQTAGRIKINWKKKSWKSHIWRRLNPVKKLLSSVYLCFLIAGALMSNHTAVGLGAWGAAVTPLRQERCTFMPSWDICLAVSDRSGGFFALGASL